MSATYTVGRADSDSRGSDSRVLWSTDVDAQRFEELGEHGGVTSGQCLAGGDPQHRSVLEGKDTAGGVEGLGLAFPSGLIEGFALDQRVGREQLGPLQRRVLLDLKDPLDNRGHLGDPVAVSGQVDQHVRRHFVRVLGP
jgi:hypothetical protein